MKCVILAGGLGTRLSEETDVRPKPMVEIGGRPMLWHIMKIYSAHGVRDFVICLGYKGEVIKEYFVNYARHMSDITVKLPEGKLTVHQNLAEDWSVTLIDTGANSMTGGRLKRIKKYVEQETFCMTYGDAVSDVDITALIAFHKASGKDATVTAVQPQGRFGALTLSEDATTVAEFVEKPPGDGGLINGGFFVLEPKALDLVADDSTIWEQEPIKQLAANGQMAAFCHYGFWQPVDTLRDKKYLESIWANGQPPWKNWP